jgi:hypothetical protein
MGEDVMDFPTFDRFIKGKERTSADSFVNPTFYVLHEICRFYEEGAKEYGLDAPLFSSYEYQTGTPLRLPALIRTADSSTFASGY